MTAVQPKEMPDDAVAYVEIPKSEWDAHVQKIDFLTGTLAGLLSALGQHPMFSGFIPPDIREQIAKLG